MSGNRAQSGSWSRSVVCQMDTVGAGISTLAGTPIVLHKGMSAWPDP